jgi:flagellar biosynthetic protein FlhB
MILLLIAPDINDDLEAGVIDSFTFGSEIIADKTLMMGAILQWVEIFAELITPIFVITAITALISSIILGGWTMSIESVKPKMEKISPAKGLKRIFSSKGFMEFLKSIFKVLIVGITSYFVFMDSLPEIYGLSQLGLEEAVSISLNMLGYYFLITSSALLLIVMMDVPFQIHSTRKELKMTKQDIKDEMKDSEGRPETKQKRNEVARKLAFSRQMDEIPTADVIITNPTHYAVGIKYNGTDDAPVVIAMGTDILALKIRTIAKQYKVNVVESPSLARSLYYFSNIGEPIHPGLYEAVAKILSYVYRLKDFNEEGVGKKPNLEDIEIQGELKK